MLIPKPCWKKQGMSLLIDAENSYRHVQSRWLSFFPHSPNTSPASPIAHEFSKSRRLAEPEAWVAITAVVVDDPDPDAKTTDVLVMVVGKQIPGLVGLQPPAQQPPMAVRTTFEEFPAIVVAGQEQ